MEAVDDVAQEVIPRKVHEVDKRALDLEVVLVLRVLAQPGEVFFFEQFGRSLHERRQLMNLAQDDRYFGDDALLGSQPLDDVSFFFDAGHIVLKVPDRLGGDLDDQVLVEDHVIALAFAAALLAQRADGHAPFHPVAAVFHPQFIDQVRRS